MLSALRRWSPPVPLLLAVIVVASLLVHMGTLVAPVIQNDDFVIVQQSWTWERTRANLWEPMNEHCWPVFRLAVYAIDQCSGGITGVPLAAMVFSRLALIAAVCGLYLFVKRERGPFAGLVAAMVFGVTAVYAEGVYWLAASPGVACVATAAVALLGGQRWVHEKRWTGLVTAVLASAVAPGWFGGGALVGPLVGLYLFGRRPGRWWAWAMPVAATAAYFAVCVPLAGERMTRPPHHGGKSAVQAFDPLTAVGNTGRAVTDQLVLGSVGVREVSCPVWVAAVVTPLAVAAWVWWWRRAGWSRAVLVGAAFVLLTYLLAYGMRAAWSYPDLLVRWSRYNIFPQFGLAVVIGCGMSGAAAVTPRRQWLVLGMTAALLVIQLRHGYFSGPHAGSVSHDQLRRVEEVDARCREHRIAADDASAVMTADNPGFPHEYLWQCLWGSPNPEPRSPDEVRRLLAE